MKRPTIALIGAGQLGSRHLQGLLNASIPMDIAVVDPMRAGHELAAQRAEEAGVPADVRIEHHYELSQLPRDVEVAIIATTAAPRRGVVESLLDHADVQHLVLEKVVFPHPHDFQPVIEMLSRRGTSSWVNFVRRCWQVYRQFSGALEGGSFQMQVNGGEWGLGTSGLHFIDLFAMLGAKTPFTVTHGDLDPELMPSRHKGLVEFTGSMTVSDARGSTLKVVARAGRRDPVTVQVAGEGVDLMVAEGRKAWVIDHGVDHEPSEIPAESPYQSMLTGEVVRELIRDGHCPLPSLALAAEVHEPFLAALIAHARACGWSGDSAPIT